MKRLLATVVCLSFAALAGGCCSDFCGWCGGKPAAPFPRSTYHGGLTDSPARK